MNPPAAKTSDRRRGPDGVLPKPPTITYRHILSAGSLQATNPMRVVSHLDVDAAYAQFEAARLGVDSHAVPLAVQQWNGLIAISYGARAFGITRHETVESARKKCPQLQLVHVATYAHGAERAEYHEDPRPETHKVSLDPYRRESKKIMRIFKESCPNAAVEKASIDESYFDLTIEVRRLLLERYPYLANYPKDGLGMDTPLPLPAPIIDWEGIGYQMPLHGPKKGEKGQGVSDASWEVRMHKRGQAGYGPAEEEVAEEEGAPAVAEPAPPPSAKGEEEDNEVDDDVGVTWVDVALALGAELMAKTRRAVQAELGYTTSAGIATNKTLAKLCSSWRKPDAQTIMRPAAVHAFLRELPFQKIRFLGGKLGDAIAQEWESNTVGDMWGIPLEQMQLKFGEESAWIYNVLRGIDYTEVRERVANKTMLASKNVRPTIKKTADAMHWFSILSTELAIRLNEARDEVPTLWPKTMVLRYLRAGDVPRSRQAPFPFVRELKGSDVLKVAEKLWNESAAEALEAPQGTGRPAEIITVSIGFSQLTAGETGQKSIEGFFGKGGDSSSGSAFRSSSTSASQAVDDAGKEKKRKRPVGIDAMFASRQESGSSSPRLDGMDQVAWKCERCSTSLRETFVKEDGDSTLREIAEQSLEMQKQEHLDMHFAMDLSREDGGGSNANRQNGSSAQAGSSSRGSSATNKKAKTTQAGDQKGKGIAAFFQKKG